ncbi:hypothetical protein EGW08_014761 [Elysia chlorotica]|uniref:Uncharacterized protein n=1 Tax=Elysia chlorotica TaxID=188477 RepID=A0A3S1BCI3_ELYCH|nr:hypothetical protein EGW08_014761 [Elysia chlorotica]
MPSREEAGVPDTYVKWLDTILPKMHMHWAKECKENPENIFKSKELKEIQANVSEEFQSWCQWYLKRHFRPKNTPKLKCEGKHRSCAGNEQKEDLTAIRKEMKEKEKSVPHTYRLWTKAFIKQWQEDHLGDQYNTTSSSGTESEAEDGAREAIPDEIIIPLGYSRWLRKFLNAMFSKKGVSLTVPDQRVVGGGLHQFNDSVPEEYRKWARLYIKHILIRYKKFKAEKVAKTRNQEAARPNDCYHKWLFAFQKQWLEQAAYPSVLAENSGPEGERVCQFEATGMDQWHDVIGSSDSEEEHEGSSQTNEIPHEFRHWAQHVLKQWDGKTLNLPPAENKDDHRNNSSDQDIPPRLLNWMTKVMTRIQKKKIKAQRKVEKQEMKMERKEAKAERKAAREGFKAAKRSMKVARKALKFRYI